MAGINSWHRAYMTHLERELTYLYDDMTTKQLISNHVWDSKKAHTINKFNKLSEGMNQMYSGIAETG